MKKQFKNKRDEVAMMDYSFYLFTRLYVDVCGTNMPYDVEYEQMTTLYNDYKGSQFDDPTQGEYECMLNFIKNLTENEN